jgi:xanthine dehydrogenase accessory factor
LVELTTIWQWLVDVLASQNTAMLMIVVSSEGSSPSKAGTKMAISTQGERFGSFGTIGGGALEYRLVKKAHDLLATDTVAPVLCRFQHNLSGTDDVSGMSCGGKQTVLLYRCRNIDIALYRQLAEMHLHKTPGTISLTPNGLQLQLQTLLPQQTQFNLQSENEWLYQEAMGICKQAYIVGGGHVSLALSKTLATLDFDITVIDERDNSETFARNHYAHRKLRIPYREVANVIAEGDQVFVFIMTHCHKTDEKVAELLADKRVRYFGVLGSQKKIEQLKTNLASRLSVESLQRIRGPIGLPINSHTPAEIAVSIAAELIQILNAQPQ